MPKGTPAGPFLPFPRGGVEPGGTPAPALSRSETGLRADPSEEGKGGADSACWLAGGRPASSGGGGGRGEAVRSLPTFTSQPAPLTHSPSTWQAHTPGRGPGKGCVQLPPLRLQSLRMQLLRSTPFLAKGLTGCPFTQPARKEKKRPSFLPSFQWLPWGQIVTLETTPRRETEFPHHHLFIALRQWFNARLL